MPVAHWFLASLLIEGGVLVGNLVTGVKYYGVFAHMRKLHLTLPAQKKTEKCQCFLINNKKFVFNYCL